MTEEKEQTKLKISKTLDEMVRRFKDGKITSIQFCYIDTELKGNIEIYIMEGDEKYALGQLNTMTEYVKKAIAVDNGPRTLN